jgi:hypothetical protein
MPANQTESAQKGAIGPAARLPRWITAVVVIGAALMSAGALLALFNPTMLSGPADINRAVHVYAGYFAVRNLALPIMLIVFLARRARAALAATMLTVALIQFLDLCFDIAEARWSILPGVLLIDVLFAMGAARLFRQTTTQLA